MGDQERRIFEVETKALGAQVRSRKNLVCRDDREFTATCFLRPAAKSIGCYSMGFGCVLASV